MLAVKYRLEEGFRNSESNKQIEAQACMRLKYLGLLSTVPEAVVMQYGCVA